jgi:hypothetical protein
LGLVVVVEDKLKLTEGRDEVPYNLEPRVEVELKEDMGLGAEYGAGEFDLERELAVVSAAAAAAAAFSAAALAAASAFFFFLRRSTEL